MKRLPYFESDEGKWWSTLEEMLMGAWTIAYHSISFIEEPETESEGLIMLNRCTKRPEGMHWGKRNGVYGLWFSKESEEE